MVDLDVANLLKAEPQSLQAPTTGLCETVHVSAPACIPASPLAIPGGDLRPILGWPTQQVSHPWANTACAQRKRGLSIPISIHCEEPPKTGFIYDLQRHFGAKATWLAPKQSEEHKFSASRVAFLGLRHPLDHAAPQPECILPKIDALQQTLRLPHVISMRQCNINHVPNGLTHAA